MPRALVVLSLLLLTSCRQSDSGGVFEVPGLLEQSVTEGGPNPTAVTFDLTNLGNCPLAYTLATSTVDGAAWVSVAPSSGNVAAGASTSIGVTIDVITTALLPGNYTGSITVSGTCTSTGQPARGSPLGVAVNLRVTPLGAAIAVSQTNIGVDTNPVADQWSAVPSNTLTTDRGAHTAIWTGREMWVFGGENTAGTVGVGGKYDPLTNQWAAMPTAGAPSARMGHTAVWTGTQMVVWGGTSAASFGAPGALASGARLSSTGWTAITSTGAPSARLHHTAVWTGTEVLVWGGLSSSNTQLGDGARYNPVTNTWSAMSSVNAPAARARHIAVWTGRELLVWGGTGSSGALADGARYNPGTNTWTTMAPGAPAGNRLVSAWTGASWVVLDGATVASYSPSQNVWRDLPDAPRARTSDNAAFAWSGTELLLWGPAPGDRYNPFTGVWSPMATMQQPSARVRASGMWTGVTFIVFGGDGLTDGASYR